MRSATVAIVLTLVAGVALLVVLGVVRDSATVYTLGVAPQGPAAKLEPRDRACQGPIEPPKGSTFDRIGLYPRGESVQLEVYARPASGGAALTRGSLAVPSATGSPPELRRAHVRPLEARAPLTVCIVNRGRRRAELWGTSSVASTTTATVNGAPVDADLGITLEHARARSLLALAPEIAERASVFHARWLSPGVWAIVVGLVVLAVPALLVVAVHRAAAD